VEGSGHPFLVIELSFESDLMSTVPNSNDAPLVVRVDDAIPIVKPVPVWRPRPGFREACILTFGYWLALVGLMLAVVMVAALWYALTGVKGDLEAKGGEVAGLPPGLRGAFAWSVPVGYLGGGLFSIIVLRVIVGRSWVHDIGLARVPLYHLALGIVALPGFMILSDVLADLVQPIDQWVLRQTGIGDLGDTSQALPALFSDFHWAFAVFAIGFGPGIVEELWCRGFLGRGLIGRYGWFAGIALSSMFFGLLHLWPPSYVLITAVMGAGLHFAYITSRSLWVPIVMHMANNSFAAMLMMKVAPSEPLENAMKSHPAPIIVAAICVLGFTGLAMWHSRWSWPGELRGILIPPETSNTDLIARKPDWIYSVAAVGFCIALLGLVLA